MQQHNSLDCRCKSAIVLPIAFIVGATGSVLLLADAARADTLSSALGKAYTQSPELNAQRANTRSVDENLPTAESGYRPTLNASADGGLLRENYHVPVQGNAAYNTRPAGYSLQLSQNVFNGFQTQNRVGQALAQIASSRETLRYTELSVLANAAQAYMHALRDAAILKLRQNNVNVLQQQVADTSERLRLGEVTMTDLHQSRAALAQGLYEMTSAETNLKASLATYQQLIGQAPVKLAPGRAPTSLMPGNLQEALNKAGTVHPLITAARADVDAASYAVKVAEGALSPTINATATTGQRYNYLSVEGERYRNNEVGMQINVPIYDGGVTYSEIRAAKEKLYQSESVFDQQFAQVQSSVRSSWAAWYNARISLKAARDEVQQAEKALAGVREEARLGQRTTLDVLNAQEYLLNSRVLVVSVECDIVVYAFSLLASEGVLSAQALDLAVPMYSPITHFEKVKNKWIGLSP